MSELSQANADALIAMPKCRVDDKRWLFPSPTVRYAIDLTSPDQREKFVLDITGSRIKLSKVSLQNRGRIDVVLVRVDIDGAPHRNPDGQEIDCPHIHVYREGWGDKWAAPLPPSFTVTTDLWTTLHDFLAYCNVSDPPIFDHSIL